MHESQKKLGAFFFETAGWERPHWYESNAALLEEYGDAVMPREHEWDARWWSPIINAEHLRMREAAGVIDLSAFCVFDIEGPGALESVQRTCVAQCDVAVGKVIYTPVLDAGRRVPLRPHRDAAGATTRSGWSPAARTAWRTGSGSPTTWSTTAPRR